MAMVAKANMLLANATPILSLVHQTKMVQVPVAAENINLVFVKLNINIHHQTALILVLYPVHLATENIRNVLAPAVSAPVLMVVKNIIILLARLFVKQLIRIIVITEQTTTPRPMVV